jgi:GNAT superfamily N-acetyltransferase
VLLARLDPERIDEQIEHAMAPFRERRLPMLWSIGVSSQPSDLAGALEGHRLVHAGAMPAMAIGLDALGAAPAPAGFTIERVTDAASLHAWARAYIDSFEMEEASGSVLREAYEGIGFADDAPARHYVGLLEGAPVASATLFLGAGVAGVWHVGTLAAARGRGIGAAMTLAPLADACALGYRAGTLHASAMGESVYGRLGFQHFGRLTQYGWSPAP